MLKSLQITPIVLTKRSKSMWDSLLANEDEAKTLAGSILKTKSMRLQTEYMGTWRSRVSLNGVAVDLTWRRSLSRSWETGYCNRWHILISRTSLRLSSRLRNIIVIVEGRRPHYTSCCSIGHLLNAYTGKNPSQTPVTPATTLALKPAPQKKQWGHKNPA